MNYIPGAQLACALRDLVGPGADVPGYRRLSYMMLDGTIRSEVVRGRRRVPEADLPAIARMLGLPVPQGALEQRQDAAERETERWSPADVAAAQGDKHAISA